MDREKKVIALGFFDGVHLGHARLLVRAKEAASETGAEAAVMTFDTHPETLVAGKNIELITSPEDRAEIIRRTFGINEVIVVHFDDEMRRMYWEDFILWMIEDFSAAHFVAGYDFHFGYKGQGNPGLLKFKCADLGIGCDIENEVTVDGVTVSSTYIRELLKNGDIKRANTFLGHNHSLTDIVRFGYKIGAKIGAPTINMRFGENVLIPARGVYATSLQIEDDPRVYYAVTNVGVRPTVNGGGKVSVESHILNFDRVVYGKRVRLEFHDFLRPERKFDSIAELSENIAQDTESVRRFFNL